MGKLIGMADFVLEQNKEVKSQTEQSRAFYHCCNYASFLKQPLELWMLVPCKLVDGAWVVLKEPERWNDYLEFPESFDGNKEWYELYGYQQAKERCLFEGWKPIAKTNITVCVENEVKHRLFFPVCMTVENIVYTNTQLTQSVQNIVYTNTQLTQSVQKKLALCL